MLFSCLEIKEKERYVEQNEYNLFKVYKTVKSNCTAEDFLETIIKKKKTLQDLEMLTQHK